jgi:Fur family peroxide stress response transcriptional regulator
MAILEYLASTAVHPSARQVFNKVRKKHPGLSLATVYNTLGTLVRMGLIKVMEFEALDNRFENNLSPHINLFCTMCGKIQDLEEAFPTSPEKVKEKIGFQILDYRMEYYGICQVCRTSSG